MQTLVQFLQANGNRQAILSETGGGNTQSCVTDVCAELSFLKHNSDVFLGYSTCYISGVRNDTDVTMILLAGWAAGSFDSTYELVETPNGSQDTLLVSSCLYQSKLS